ncbi:MAG: hypothetical protein ACXVQU_07510 [Actinomycetota bacterium]
MANDRLIRKLQQVDVVRRDLAAFLDRLGVAIRAGIATLRRGVPVSDQTQNAAAVHVELVQKLDDMHHAVHQARAEGVRVLVEDEGLPVSTVAQLMGRPRQLVARLYQQAVNGTGTRAARRNSKVARRAANGSAAGREATTHRPTGAERTGASRRTRIPPAAQ